MKWEISIALLTLLCAACTPTNQTTVKTETTAATEEKEFDFFATGNKPVKVRVLKGDKNLALFTPPLDDNNRNFNLARAALYSEVYGKERRLIFDTATAKPLTDGGNAVCEQIKSSPQRFCSAPSHVSDADKRIGAIAFWVE